jgi:hypothetical protein
METVRSWRSRCHCGLSGQFGYRDQFGTLVWYCTEHRLAKYWSDARRDTAATPAVEATKPPDLQELVALFGGYDKITPEAWAEHDRAMVQWHHDRRVASVGHILESNEPPKKARK